MILISSVILFHQGPYLVDLILAKLELHKQCTFAKLQELDDGQTIYT